MPITNRIAEFAADMKAWRRHLHQHPELGFDTANTAAFVAERLREFGVDELHEGIAKNGLVALIHGQGAGPTIGLRADMDALPIVEETGAKHASLNAGKMHACGHDGHTTMLLGAARYLAETRNFAGTVALIFQPAEEDGGGGQAMVAEGMLERFNIAQVYALHTVPGKPLGHFFTNPGALMAADDTFHITIKGRGAHAAYPEEGIDPIVVGAQMVSAIYAVRARRLAGLDNTVISITQFHAGSADNIIPETAFVGGTVRTLSPETRKLVADLLPDLVANCAASFGASATLTYSPGYPITMNDPAKTAFAVEIARRIAGHDNVQDDIPPEMGVEDFSYLLEQRPGAYLFLGQGDGPGLHHPKFDFNDEAAPIGASFFAQLVEAAQTVKR
ncbi:MAG: M20 aminoacylase family protein [Paracoccaceae bacterium]